jgi:hypothetical protein
VVSQSPVIKRDPVTGIDFIPMGPAYGALHAAGEVGL